MIFVVLGTHELPFTRLLNLIEEQVKSGNIQDEVIVQIGHTKYDSPYFKKFPFTSYEEMEKLYKKSDLVITHGGTGSITTGVKMGKTMIAVPRLIKYGEHNDDHQIEIVSQFEKAGHILSLYEHERLENVLEKAKVFEPTPFVSGKKEIINILREFILNKK
ncbi:PssE/Cps14G family polysaccharide biosynthesis glycosyltransferase [Bacillus sp. AK128]